MSPSADPRRILVLGLGNPDRGDDGVGPAVARALAGRLPEGVALAARSGDMLALLDDWAAADALVCVDAAAPMGVPGRIHRIDPVVEPLPLGTGLASSHAMGLAEALGLARALGQAPREIIVYAVEGSCFEDGAALSREVAEAAAAVADRIIAEVARLRHGNEEAMHHA